MANSPSGDSMISRIVRIISAFDRARPVMSTATLSRLANIPLATTHRLVRELCSQDMLQKDASGDLRIGIRLWELVNRSSQALDLRDVAMPFMDDIQAVVRQHTQLGILQDDEVLFIARLSSRGSVLNEARVASRLPIHVSSSGIVQLAHAPRHVQEAYLERQRQQGAPESTLADLRRQLVEIKHQGYAALPGKVIGDTTGIAVPVFGPDRKVIAGLGVVVQTGEENIPATVPALLTAARGMSRAMGATDLQPRP